MEEILKIGPKGLETGKRKKKDGFTFFGYEEENEDNVRIKKIIFIIILIIIIIILIIFIIIFSPKLIT
jgi:hypothetical protein